MKYFTFRFADGSGSRAIVCEKPYLLRERCLRERGLFLRRNRRGGVNKEKIPLSVFCENQVVFQVDAENLETVPDEQWLEWFEAAS